MTAPLKACLLLLVLIDLAFVHVTRVVSPQWLLPLCALALFAPLLARMQQSLAYRVVWNGGVLVIFALLVHDATHTGVRHMLKDGLILAAFCQVHLLNNLRHGQKPDLLFFNSFLIPIVTSFFSQDLVYFFVFLCYVPVLVLGLQLAVLDARGGPRPSFGPVARQAARRSAVLVAFTAIVFVVVPRDFQREGLVASHLRWSQRKPAEIGFSEQVRLGRARGAQIHRVVLRIEVASGDPARVPSHWRGATFPSYTGGGWRAEHRLLPAWSKDEDAWSARGPGRWSRNKLGSGPRLRVEVSDRDASRLFAPWNAKLVRLEPPADPMLGSVLRDGTLRYVRIEGRSDREFAYEVALHDGGVPPGGTHDPQAARRNLAFTYVDARDVPASLQKLVRRALRGLTPDAPQHVRVERMRSYLSTRLAYVLPGEAGAAASLGEFCAGEAGGHCEFFATALAVMLRTNGIPCRLVTGFLATEWNDARSALTVRSKHAHAWVEVLDPAAGWYTVDPSPVRAEAARDGGLTFVEHAGEWLRGLWARITGLDAKGRAVALTWLGALPSRLASWLAARPWLAALILSSLVAWLWWHRRRRAQRAEPVILRYQRAVRRSGLRPAPGETPRELLLRALDADLRPEQREELVAATEIHENARYRGGKGGGSEDVNG